MAKIKKLQEGGATIYPATITNAVKDPTTGKTLTELLGDGVQSDGTYPKMTAGFAENIVGDGSATPEVFSFRPTAGEERNVENTTILYDGAKNGEAKIKILKGNSVMWNQVQKKSSSSQTISGVTFTINEDGSITANGTASEDALFQLQPVPFINGHKYIRYGAPSGGKVDGYYKYAFTTGKASIFGPDFGEGCIFTAAEDVPTGFTNIKIYAGVTATNLTFRPKHTDLTKMFGAGNEPTTIAAFYERLPKGVDINAYEEGRIIDGNYGALKTTGYNQWDEQWEVGSINGGAGNNVGYSKGIRSVNYIPALANTKYFFHVGRTCSITVCCYDNKYNFLGSIAWGATINRAYTTLPNTSYIRFATYSSSGVDYGNVYQNDICISLAWSEYADMQGLYLPYKSFVRDLSWINKYFPATINGETKYGVRSAGGAHDEFRFNSTTQKWEAVQNVGVRAYAEGDTENAEVTTDGTNTNYPLSTPIVTEINEDVNLDFDCADYGTEELIVAEGEKSAPLSADIIYQPNAVKTLGQVPDILRRLNALESAMAQQTTNVEPSNVEE